MDWVVVGLAAGALTSTSFVPQILKGWRTRQLGDVSPAMLVVMFSGLALWLMYGFARNDIVLIVANSVGMALTGSLLVLWWRYGRGAPTVRAGADPGGR